LTVWGNVYGRGSPSLQAFATDPYTFVPVANRGDGAGGPLNGFGLPSTNGMAGVVIIRYPI
jgi:hypothetical protein